MIAFPFPIPFRIDSWLRANRGLCSRFHSVRPREGTRPAYSYTHHSRGSHPAALPSVHHSARLSLPPPLSLCKPLPQLVPCQPADLNLIVWPVVKGQPILLERPASSIVGSSGLHIVQSVRHIKAPKPCRGSPGFSRERMLLNPSRSILASSRKWNPSHAHLSLLHRRETSGRNVWHACVCQSS